MKRKMIIIATTVLSLCMFSGCQKSQLETLSQETESSYQSLIKVETTTLQNEDKKTEIQNSNQSSEVNEETNSNITLDESRIIKDQTFVVTLNDWGEVTFVTYGPKPGVDFEDVTFYLMKNKKEFHLAKDLIDDITNQMNESDLTINGIYKYLKSK